MENHSAFGQAQSQGRPPFQEEQMVDHTEYQHPESVHFLGASEERVWSWGPKDQPLCNSLGASPYN